MDPGERGVGIGAVVADAGLGAALRAWELTRPARHLAGAAASTAATVVLHLTPPDLLTSLTERGRSGRSELLRLAEALLRFGVRRVVAAVVETVDLTELVRRHVDLDAVAAGIDLDAAVARVDLDTAVARVDIDAAVARADIDAAVARVDIDAIVRRVDLDAIVRRIDLDDVAARLDLDALAGKINPDPVVARVDIDAVLARVDIVGLAREVIDAVDLPEIVRHSTGTLTSDTIRTVRRGGMQADEVVSGVVDRLLRRQGRRATARS